MAYRQLYAPKSYFETDVSGVNKPNVKAGKKKPFWSKRVPLISESGRVVRGGMWPHQKAWWELPDFIKVLVAGYGAGKCAREGTEYFDPVAGTRRTVEQKGSCHVASKVAGMCLLPRVAKSVRSGVKECVRVSLANGSFVDVSPDHKILTSDGWVAAAKLQPDQLVAIPKRLPTSDTVEASDLEIEFIAFLMADGSLTANNCAFFKQNEEIISRVEYLVESLGGGCNKTWTNSNCFRLDITALRPLIRKYEQSGKKSKDKRLPASWYGMSKHQAIVFLRAFLSCDAYFGPRNLEITLASFKLVDDLRHLLLLLGVQCQTTTKRIRLNGKTYHAKRLVLGGDNYRKLLRLLGKVPGRGLQIAKAHLNLDNKKDNPNLDLVPVGKPDLGWIGRKHGIQTQVLRSFCGGAQRSLYSRNKLKAMLKLFSIKDRYLHELAYGDLGWSRVRRVGYLGKFPVYDLSVDDPNHNFVAQNIVVHNTLVGAKRILILALQNAPAPVAAVSPTFPLAKKTIVPTIDALLSGKRQNYGKAFWYRYNKVDHEYTIRFHGRHATIYVLSGEDVESLRGPNLAAAWMDEPFLMEKAVFLQMMARVRHPDSVLSEICCTGTPEGSLGWGFDLCRGELKADLEEFGDITVGTIQASTRQNLALGTGYVKRMEGAFTDRMVEAYIEGAFINLSEGLVYYGFSPYDSDPTKRNLISIPEVPEGAELGCGMDFNVNPMSAVVFWRAGSHCHIFAEHELQNSDTEYMCQILQENYVNPEKRVTPKHVLEYIYPDASGAARKTSSPSGRTDFHYIRSAGFQIRAHSRNPRRKDRYNAVNGKFRPFTGPTTLTVDPRCKHLSKYLQNLSHENMNKQQGMLHLTDAASYFVEYLFPVFKDRQGAYKLSGL